MAISIYVGIFTQGRAHISRETSNPKVLSFMSETQLQNSILANWTPPLTHPLFSSAMVTISEARSNARDNRTAAHTHIKGLGLREDGHAVETANGFVGQAAAREVSHCELISYRI